MSRVLSVALVFVGSAFVVDLFLRWGPADWQVDGLDTELGKWSLGTAVLLILWELLGASGVRRTERSDSLITFFLASGTALAAIGNVVNLRWGGLAFRHGTGYGAWLGLALAGLLLAGGLLRLVEHARGAAANPRGRAMCGALTVVSAAYVVDLMLPWGPSEGILGHGRLVPHGINVLPGELGLSSAVGLLLWELVGTMAIRRTARSDSLVAGLFAATAALIGVIAIAELRWNARSDPHSLDYGAWIALPLIGLLLAGAVAHVVEHVRRSRTSA